MKHILPTLALLTPMSMVAQTWVKQLYTENTDIIDSVVVVKGDYGDSYGLRSYHIYYHQPISHAQPEGETLQLRATLTTHVAGNPTKNLTQCYCSGYNIHEYDWTYTSYYIGEKDIRFEIANKYKGNVLQVEHRFYGESQPKSPWLKIDNLNAEEAAADLHALIGAMKKVFTGKWVMNGISKGGATAAMQQAYHPDDFDLYISYAGPMMKGMKDTQLMHYYTTKAWTEDVRERMLNLQRYALRTPEVFNTYWTWYSYYYPGHDKDYWMSCFLEAVHMIDLDYHAYKDRKSVSAQLDKNDELLKQITEEGNYYNELITLIFYYRTLDGNKAWADYLTNNAKARLRQGNNMPRKMDMQRYVPIPLKFSEKDWMSNDMQPYYYQALREHGYFAPDFRCILTDPSELETAQEMNLIWEKHHDNYIISTCPYMKDVKYDPLVRLNTFESTLNNKRPMVYIYGQDDYWTGGGVPDEMVNGTETFKFILEAQNHNVCITNATQSERMELWDKIDYLLNIAPSDIIDMKPEKGVSAESGKNAIYSLSGQRVAHPCKGGIYIVDGIKRLYK